MNKYVAVDAGTAIVMVALDKLGHGVIGWGTEPGRVGVAMNRPGRASLHPPLSVGGHPDGGADIAGAGVAAGGYRLPAEPSCRQPGCPCAAPKSASAWERASVRSLGTLGLQGRSHTLPEQQPGQRQAHCHENRRGIGSHAPSPSCRQERPEQGCGAHPGHLAKA